MLARTLNAVLKQQMELDVFGPRRLLSSLKQNSSDWNKGWGEHVVFIVSFFSLFVQAWIIHWLGCGVFFRVGFVFWGRGRDIRFGLRSPTKRLQSWRLVWHREYFFRVSPFKCSSSNSNKLANTNILVPNNEGQNSIQKEKNCTVLAKIVRLCEQQTSYIFTAASAKLYSLKTAAEITYKNI